MRALYRIFQFLNLETAAGLLLHFSYPHEEIGVGKNISEQIWASIELEEYTVNSFLLTEIAAINFFPFPIFNPIKSYAS